MNPILAQLKESIKSKISNLNYTTWFRHISDASVKDGAFIINVPNKFVADWINDYYHDLISQELLSIANTPLKISFNVFNEAPTPEAKPAPVEQKPREMPKARIVDNLNPKYTFDRFVVGSSNEFAAAAAKAVGEMPGGKYNPLFIYGGVGLGKTHLLHAIGLAAPPEMHVIYVSAEKFMNELIVALRNEKMDEFRKKYRDKCDVLLVDDVQFLGGKERTQEEFFHTFNTLHDSHRQIVVTSDRLPKDMQGMEDRLVSRLGWGLIADIGPPDLETRIAILKKKAEIQNLECPDDVAMFLASAIKTNVRELEGSLIRINAFASLTGAEVTVDLSREIMGNSIEESRRLCTVETIQRTVSEFFKLTVTDLKSQRRLKSLTHPRQIAMYLCKKHVRSSFPEIGLKFGGKDHTTVMHACKKIEKLLEVDAHLQNDISILEKNILH